MGKYTRVKNMDKIKLFGLLFLLIAIISITPIFINLLMSFNIGVNVIDSNDWIGFHASYIGAIFGGIISGVLTLGGVFLTIKNQEKKEKQNRFPKVSLNMDFVIEKMQDITLIERLLKRKDYHNAIKLSEEVLMNKEDVLQRSANVNAVFYKINRDLIKELEMVLKLRRLVKFEKDDIGQDIPLYNSLDEFEDIISNICGNLLSGNAYLNKEYEFIVKYYQDSII